MVDVEAVAVEGDMSIVVFAVTTMPTVVSLAEGDDIVTGGSGAGVLEVLLSLAVPLNVALSLLVLLDVVDEVEAEVAENPMVTVLVLVRLLLEVLLDNWELVELAPQPS